MKRTWMIVTAGLIGLGAAGCVKDLALAPLPPKVAVVVHYWHFNALPTGTITAVTADVSKLSGAEITYPGTGAGYMDQVDPGSLLNAASGQLAGLGLRPRNPANTRDLIVVAPSTGYEKLVVTFAVMRSSSGAAQEDFSYSVDGGTTWVVVGAAYNIELDYALKTVDLAAVAAVNNKATLRFRIRFLGDLAAGASGNNRFDNFKVEGVPIS